MRQLELLAPAKNLECGIAAIDHGADAVYIGAQKFGARVAAGNSVDDIRQLCTYAHQFAAKVYVTVNTIIYDDELEATRQLLDELSAAGVDAILVQDMAVLKMLRNGDCPHVSSVADYRGTVPQLHASTQTDNRTVEKVKWLAGLGFKRVVLARELSVEEIAEIHAQVPDVELEVFVHGALCVSYSGQCYASQHCFGRSANRGACAQVCRMKFDLVDADGRELEHQRYLLSLKDLNQSAHLEELAEAGATSFKIEGRLKDVSYVKNVVAAYSQRLDSIIAKYPDKYCRASKGHCTYTFMPNLKKTFNRGFTTYFLHGRQPDVFSPDTPKAMGEFVGTVKEMRRDSFNVAGTAAFANGDGLCFINQEHDLEGFRVNRAEGNRLFPQQMPRNLRPGMALYRNNDMEFERLLARQSSVRKIPITMMLAPTPDGYSLAAEGVTATIQCEHQQAEKPQRDNIIRQLSKLGGTPYECSGVEMPSDFNAFIPSSLLADLRRQLVENIRGERLEVRGERLPQTTTPLRTNYPLTSHPSPLTSEYPYLYNIANHLAADFYGVKEPTAFELNTPSFWRGKGEAPLWRGQGEAPLLMQCRHCLQYAMGYCVKHGGQKPTYKYPLFLRLGDGRRFRLEFDCKHCQMNVYAE